MVEANIKRIMKLNNPFSDKIRELFRWQYECWVCGKNQQDALHHIMGRGNKDSKVNTSPLNAAPIHNFSCHIENSGPLATDAMKGKLLRKTRQYLNDMDYELTELDREFIKKYKKIYETY